LAWVFGFLSPCPAAGPSPREPSELLPRGQPPPAPSPVKEMEELRGSPGKVADAGRKERKLRWKEARYLSSCAHPRSRAGEAGPVS
jgi:hypothetical protein